MQKVAPLVFHLLVQTRNHDLRFISVAAAFELAAECLLCPSQLAGLRAIPTRVVDGFTRRECSQRLQTHVDTNICLNRRICSRGDLLLSHEADIPMTTGFLFEGRALGDAFEGAV